MKYTDKLGAEAGSFQPFAVGEEEIVLTSLVMRQIAAGDRIMLRLEVGWEKPYYWDTGELEIIVRQDRADGPVVYWTLETCFEQARTIDTVTVTGTRPEQLFYLSVRSAEGRARIGGHYSLQGTVYAP